MAPTYISSYANLETQVASWLNRTDLTDQIPVFIELTEAEILRRLRLYTTHASISISQEETPFPSGCVEMRSLRLSTGILTADVPLITCTAEQLARHRAGLNLSTGRPLYVCYENGTIWVAPVPDTAYTGDATYFMGQTGVDGTSLTFLGPASAPDLYLYGSLMQAELFLEHDQAAQGWEGKFEKSFEQYRVYRDALTFPSMTPITLPVQF